MNCYHGRPDDDCTFCAFKETMDEVEKKQAELMAELASERSKADALRQRITELEHRVEVCQKFHGEKS